MSEGRHVFLVSSRLTVRALRAKKLVYLRRRFFLAFRDRNFKTAVPCKKTENSCQCHVERLTALPKRQRTRVKPLGRENPLAASRARFFSSAPSFREEGSRSLNLLR